ncbi:spore germination protein GerPC [Paenibacillus aurantius]|uniref:Spore germination protein GerPC n=1 Tax=Paenibacillus aurantius TaxID=2918900 RepID=A0AA96LD67_9BACL|nr:spore germination protein GerPC [Paenibacillus aurantius]WNQ10010.1 spore germination protein GerPC [Paenibacillus aurantius]
MDFYGMLCQIKGHLEWQSRKLLEVEARLVKLESSVASLQDKPQTRIDKIDYHFDQLKVERLDGTLNIGITPGKDGADSIEEFAVNQRKPVQAEGQPAEAGAPSEELVREAGNVVEGYLRRELPGVIRALEECHRLPLGERYREWMVEDLRKQLKPRVEHYARGIGKAEDGEGASPAERIADQVKQDIEAALQSHFERLLEQGGERNESDGLQ